MIEARSTAFEKGGYDYHTQFLGQLSQRLGRRTGDRLGQLKIVVVLALTEILA
jgi:hypothetical protein